MHFLKIAIIVVFAACEVIRICAINMDNAQIVLRETNERRRRHGCPELSLDLDLSQGCQTYAWKLAKDANLTYSDPTNKEYTENICRYPIKRGALSRCVHKWYHGSKLDFTDPKAKEFTAMIWRSSRNMGYGDANINDCPGHPNIISYRYIILLSILFVVSNNWQSS
ncbi:Golgi-associated plant pathogenesis-related protein 1 isoform X2 [Drosophila eugracilis]|uniref:Golgi-associated plant pathogenesis-related protein 1 isoform X2 n=1 Tax=Drosophila eugracilis TaxID=29029 RepID=UPI0007E87EA6|nr:Golgi-associated plant pathogenesis-related protein 1 isoform X2 [Drosophila eugracilis]